MVSPLPYRLRRSAIAQARKQLHRFGIEVGRSVQGADLIGDSGRYLPRLTEEVGDIPGMITLDQGITLYWMAYSQSIRGDVIEIGSWQGRSTAFLAAACRDSGNGKVHAIDHFRGNPGKERMYSVGSADLSDLRDRFLQNVERVELRPWVALHAGASGGLIEDVRRSVRGTRLIYIDGLHTYEAVAEDLRNYAPLLGAGGLLVLDDYSPSFPGVVAAVKDFLRGSPEFGLPVQGVNTLTLRRGDD